MFPYDQSFKLVSEEDTIGSLKHIAGVSLSAKAHVESLDRELNVERLHADHLYRVRDRGKECIHHLEAISCYRAGWEQAQIDHAMYVGIKYRVPVFSHLLVLHQRGAPRTIRDQIVRVSGGLRHTLRVNVVCLWKQPVAAILRTRRIALYPWTMLMDASVDEQREAARRLEISGREGLIEQMALLGSFRYGGRENFLERIGRMLITEDLLRQSPLWKELERKGRVAGRAEAKAVAGDALRQLLVFRFGPLPDWAEQKLNNADLRTVQRFIKQTAAAATLDSALQ